MHTHRDNIHTHPGNGSIQCPTPSLHNKDTSITHTHVLSGSAVGISLSRPSAPRCMNCSHCCEKQLQMQRKEGVGLCSRPQVHDGREGMGRNTRLMVTHSEVREQRWMLVLS